MRQIALILMSALLCLAGAIAPAFAWVYTVSSVCNTGAGANGTAVTCEPQPLIFPSDCYFVELGYPTGNTGNYVASLDQRGNFTGDCSGASQYINHHFPDTSGQITAMRTCLQTPYTLDWYITPSGSSVLSADGTCLPSTLISCQLQNLVTLGCWRNSTDIAINGGFETIYATRYETGWNYLDIVGNKTYMPGWNLPTKWLAYGGNPNYATGFPTNITADAWWGKADSQFLNTSWFNGNLANYSLSMPVQLPPFSDIGNLWNISYNLETNVNTTASPFDISVFIKFNDDTTFALQTISAVNLGTRWSADYNGTYTTLVNFGSEVGDAELFFFAPMTASGFSEGHLYLDNVNLVSECAGVNCTTALNYTPPAHYCGNGICDGGETCLSCATDCHTGCTATTTIPTGGAAEALSGVAGYAGALLGGDVGLGKLILWVSGSILISVGVAYELGKANSNNWVIDAIILLVLLVVGVFADWVPLWVGAVMLIAGGAILAKTINDARGGG